MDNPSVYSSNNSSMPEHLRHPVGGDTPCPLMIIGTLFAGIVMLALVIWALVYLFIHWLN